MGKAQLEQLEQHGMYMSVPRGRSMLPMLRSKRDIVEIHRLEPPAERCDLVLYVRGEEQQGVLHRVIAVREKDYVIAGDNCWIHDFVVIQNDTTIGNNVAIMAQTLIGDNAVIEDHCFLGAKSTVGGGSVIGEQTFVGINCTVFDDTKVGKKCILGACTSVKRNVPDYSLYKTSSEIVIKQYGEDVIESKLMFSKNVRK